MVIVRLKQEDIQQFVTLMTRQEKLLEDHRKQERFRKDFYGQLVEELGEVKYNLEQWWEENLKKYGLEGIPMSKLHFDFKNGEVIFRNNL